jgi:hypothetical protein
VDDVPIEIEEVSTTLSNGCWGEQFVAAGAPGDDDEDFTWSFDRPLKFGDLDSECWVEGTQ